MASVAISVVLLAGLLGCPPVDGVGAPTDSLLPVGDGTYAGPVMWSFTTDADPLAAAVTTTQEGYVLLDVADGSVTLLRFGAGPVGGFDAWVMQDGAIFTETVELDGATLEFTRTMTGSGASSIAYSVHLEHTANSATSYGDGTGLLAVTSDGQNLSLNLSETVTFASGPLTGQLQHDTLSGQLSKIDDVAAPQPVDKGGGGGETPLIPPAPPPAGTILTYRSTGMGRLADGSPFSFTGIREAETIENPDGEPFNVVTENRVRTVTAADGSTTQVSVIFKTYFEYNPDGQGRIIGFQEDGQDRFIVEPFDGVPGAVDILEVGRTRSFNCRYDDGTVDDLKEKITDISQVLLLSGVFDVFISRVHLERTLPDGTVQTTDLISSIHPTLGVIHRHEERSVRSPDGSLVTTEFEEYLDQD